MADKSDMPSTRRKSTTHDPLVGDGQGVRLIFTKHRTYALPGDQAGIPVQAYFPGVELPGPLAHAKIYEASGGLVAAIPEAALNAQHPTPTLKKRRRGRLPSLG
jgi:hypothetical protein